MEQSDVRIWKETVVIPTYEVGKPDKNPMFFENRVYQGSSGVVYPNPVIDKIYDEKVEKSYIGLFLENRYLKILILPELGGRVQMAFDKIRQRHFVYYNQVIKPALVGLCGPWISGGIEFNWPQHHRPSTFEPIDYDLEEATDGSKIVWVNEFEKMFGTRALTGFVLHPNKAFLEIRTSLLNRTAIPQTFLWWANPAVKVNDHYQSVFPPDVNAVFDHGKRDVSGFPIATGTYYKVNYAPGTDISRYKNIPVPTSYMAIHSEFNFLGGYEHDSRAGVLHVANHHVSPGKKQWTWGNGDFGKAWDRNLTDEDGPYIELMAGVFTDNQPDFSWLMPYEEKSFTQYFLPYRELGIVKNASKDILFGMEKMDDRMIIRVQVTAPIRFRLKVMLNEKTLLDKIVDLRPESIYSHAFTNSEQAPESAFSIIALNEQEQELLVYKPGDINIDTLPEPAKPALSPAEITTNEELYLTGLHLEQYRHATYSPVPYYEEALKRDPSDIRNNNGLGLWYYRRGQFAKSEAFFRKAIATLTRKNPNPYDGEPFYNLALCLNALGKYKEAYAFFYKGAWNSAWQHSCYFSLAQLDCRSGNFESALDHVNQSINRNAGNGKAYHLKTIILRNLSRFDEALKVIETALRMDRFNLGIYFENILLAKLMKKEVLASDALNKLLELSRAEERNFLEFAIDYTAAGFFKEAIGLLDIPANDPEIAKTPMIWYYMAWMFMETGNMEKGFHYFEKAAGTDSAYCFPNRLQDIKVLGMAIRINEKDAMAPYYLGNLWYDKRQYADAVENWELAAQRNPSFATVHRNLGIAYFNKHKNIPLAVNSYENAFGLNKQDARVLMELDQLYKRINRSPKERLVFLEQNLEQVNRRDDLYLERVALHNFLGNHELAYGLIMKRIFHPWEGGEGKVSGQYCYSLVELAKIRLHSGQPAEAIALLKQAQQYPPNLGEGKLFGVQENDIYFWLGIACEDVGEKDKAATYFEKATQGGIELAAAMVYNDQQPDKIFYQGLACEKIDQHERAKQLFHLLKQYGIEHLNDEIRIDYFAVSLPDLLIFEDDFKKRNRVHCHYMAGLGMLGLHEFNKAKEAFMKGLQEDAMHVGCKTHLQLAVQLESSSTVEIG